MGIDLLTIFALIFGAVIIWAQRKTIFELQRDVFEIESAYKEETGRVYRYKHRIFEGWGNDGEKQKEGQN